MYHIYIYILNTYLYIIIGLVVTKTSERFLSLFGRNKHGSNSMIPMAGINHSRDEGLRDVRV